MSRLRSRAGFTLAEVILATLLSTAVLIGLAGLMVPLTRTQVSAHRGQMVQTNLAFAMSVIDRELRQANYVRSPGAAAGSSVLEGVQNAAPPPRQTIPIQLDPAKPVRWFAFCADQSTLYYHTGANWPPIYVCGQSPAGRFGAGGTVAATFRRPSALATVIDVSLRVASRNESSEIRSAIGFAAAAGTNQ